MGYYRKNTNWGEGVGWGEVKDMEFSEVLKKERVEISGLIKKEVEIPGASRKKFVEFPLVLVFDLGISKGCHNFAEFPGGEACFLWDF